MPAGAGPAGGVRGPVRRPLLLADLFSSLAQRRGFREHLAGLLAPRDRNKTLACLACLAGAEPVVGPQHPAVRRLRFFLSESRWDPEQVNFRAAVADGGYGDLDDFRCEPHAAKVPFVRAVKRRRGIWTYGDQARTPVAGHTPGLRL